jgi:glycosyltransferase involved in cell wall biosynthesis
VSSQRLLILVTDLEIGGTPTVVRELATRLKARGRDVSVACLAPRGPVAPAIEAAGVPVHALNARGPWDIGAILRLDRLVHWEQYDCIFSLLLHANAAASAVAALRRVRLVQSIQTTQPWPRWHWAVQRLIAPAAERIIVPSPSVAWAAYKFSGIRASSISIIPNGVQCDPPIANRKSQIADSSIGFLGRLDPVKRVPEVVEAAALLAGRVHLHIFGEGADRPRIEQCIARLDAGSYVTMHGRTDSPRQALAQMQLLVLASEAEGFPLVVVEAMAAGVPVVATDAPGIRDVVQDGQTGLLAPVGAPVELARQITRLLDDPALAGRLADNAQRHVRDAYGWERIIDQYEGLLFEQASR